jgi:hypothetical protein
MILLLGFSAESRAQQKTELEADGYFGGNDLDLSYGIALKYNKWINPYIGYTVGVKLNRSWMDEHYDSPTDDDVSYHIDETVGALNGMVGLKVSTPTWHHMGIAMDALFVFAPIPYQLVGVDRKTSIMRGEIEETRLSKMVYTHFSPSYSFQMSCFYSMFDAKNKSIGRLSIGCGLNNYNAHHGYYHATLDGISLRKYLKLIPRKMGIEVFARYAFAID